MPTSYLPKPYTGTLPTSRSMVQNIYFKILAVHYLVLHVSAMLPENMCPGICSQFVMFFGNHCLHRDRTLNQSGKARKQPRNVGRNLVNSISRYQNTITKKSLQTTIVYHGANDQIYTIMGTWVISNGIAPPRTLHQPCLSYLTPLEIVVRLFCMYLPFKLPVRQNPPNVPLKKLQHCCRYWSRVSKSLRRCHCNPRSSDTTAHSTRHQPLQHLQWLSNLPSTLSQFLPWSKLVSSPTATSNDDLHKPGVLSHAPCCQW